MASNFKNETDNMVNEELEAAAANDGRGTSASHASSGIITCRYGVVFDYISELDDEEFCQHHKEKAEILAQKQKHGFISTVDLPIKADYECDAGTNDCVQAAPNTTNLDVITTVNETYKGAKLTSVNLFCTHEAVMNNCFVPVLRHNQDMLIGQNAADFSEPDTECDEGGEPLWSRLTHRLQIHLPKFDYSYCNQRGEFDDVISGSGCSIFALNGDVAIEVTVIIKKNMNTGTTSFKAEFVKNDVDRRSYCHKFNAAYEMLNSGWQQDNEEVDAYEGVRAPSPTHMTFVEGQRQVDRKTLLDKNFPVTHTMASIQIARNPLCDVFTAATSYNDDYVRSYSGAPLMSITNGWRTDLLPSMHVYPANATCLANKYIRQAFDVVNNHSTYDKYQLLAYTPGKKDADEAVNNLILSADNLNYPAISACLSVGSQVPSMNDVQYVHDKTKDNLYTFKTGSSCLSVVDIHSQEFMPVSGLRSASMYHGRNYGVNRVRMALLQELTRRGFKFTKNGLTGQGELMRGPYNGQYPEVLCGITHSMVVHNRGIPEHAPHVSEGGAAAEEEHEFLKRVDLLPPRHLAVSSVKNIFNNMQGLILLDNQYGDRPHVLITINYPRGETKVDVENGKLYETHQSLGLVTIVWSKKKIKQDLLVEVRTDANAPSVSFMRTTEMDPSSVGFLHTKL